MNWLVHDQLILDEIDWHPVTKEAYHGKTCKKAKLRSEVFDKEIV